jgi:hypothetical protein
MSARSARSLTIVSLEQAVIRLVSLSQLTQRFIYIAPSKDGTLLLGIGSRPICELSSATMFG